MQPANFVWQGALIAFLTYNPAIGTKIVEKALRSLFDKHTSAPGRSARAEGAGHVLNYLIQAVPVTLGGGYLTASARRRVQGTRLVQNWCRWALTEADSFLFAFMIFYTIGAILLWVKMFSDTPLLRQLCIYTMSWIFPQHRAHVTSQHVQATMDQ
jgi:hypothetical protein